MLNQLLALPQGYYVLGLMVAAAVLVIVYWQRAALKRELQRWRLKQLQTGPITFERTTGPSSRPGVSFGDNSNFSGAKVEGIAGRDIIRGHSTNTSPGKATPGVDFGNGNFRNAEIRDVAGRDIVDQNDRVPSSEPHGENQDSETTKAK